jgi:hypothetical protein
MAILCLIIGVKLIGDAISGFQQLAIGFGARPRLYSRLTSAQSRKWRKSALRRHQARTPNR